MNKNEKDLRDELRFLKDRINTIETQLEVANKKEENNCYCTCGCCDCDEAELKNVEVDISISCNDECLKEVLQEYLSEVVANALDEFFDDKDDFDKNDEHETEIKFLPFINKKSGEIIGVIVEETCLSCGESYVINIFTDGSDEAEILAEEMGYRD